MLSLSIKSLDVYLVKLLSDVFSVVSCAAVLIGFVLAVVSLVFVSAYNPCPAQGSPVFLVRAAVEHRENKTFGRRTKPQIQTHTHPGRLG